MPLSFHLRLLALQFIISVLLSGAITFINKGFNGEFFVNWAKGFVLTFILIPIVVRFIPSVKAFLAKTFRQTNPGFLFKCFAALCVAVMMETLIAFALTSLQNGWDGAFIGQWLYSTVMALPVGMMIGLAMVFWIEPKIHAFIEEGHRIKAAKAK